MEFSLCTENPIHGVTWPRNRAHGAVGQNRSCSIKWAAKQEKFRPMQKCFFLTAFIERTRCRLKSMGAEAVCQTLYHGTRFGAAGSTAEAATRTACLGTKVTRKSPNSTAQLHEKSKNTHPVAYITAFETQ